MLTHRNTNHISAQDWNNNCHVPKKEEKWWPIQREEILCIKNIFMWPEKEHKPKYKVWDPLISDINIPP